MKIALLSNVTVEVLARIVSERHDVWTPSGFGAWFETALNIPESLKAFAPEAIFFLMDRSHATVNGDVAVARAALAHTFPKARIAEVDSEDVALEFEEKTSPSTVHLHLSPSPSSSFYDERMWKLASMPWSLAGLDAIAAEIERLAAAKDPIRKVLALDLDNTLWDGIVSEVGVGGIRPRVAFQQEILSLKARGVLLVALSKNDAAVARAAFDNRAMVLKREDFVAWRVNWRDKADNLRDLAAALNLGTDAFVFVDDRASERERMRQALPDVATPDFPITGRRLKRLYFPEGAVTDEDRRKTEIYRGAANRRQFAETLSFEDYLKGLAIRVTVRRAEEGDFERLAQLSQKSNQFNAASNRYTADDLRRLARDAQCRVFAGAVRDRFADDGLSALAVVALSGGGAAELGEFVLSCRVMNRRVEDTFLAAIKRELANEGVTALSAVYRDNGRNVPAREFLARNRLIDAILSVG